jgi:chromosome segregation ATPase
MITLYRDYKMDTEQEILYLKQELKMQERQIYTLDIRSNSLEINYNHQSDQLNKIEKNVDKVFDALQIMQKTLSENNGASAAKGKLHNNIYMWLTFAVLFAGNIFWEHWK